MNIRRPYIVLLLVVITIAVYYPAMFAEFNSVDDIKMVNHIENLEGIDLKGLFFGGGSGSYYRPFLYLTFIVDKYAWGMLPSFMHLENVLLHALNAVLVFLVAGQVFSLRGHASLLASFSAALLFAVHPINTEAVNWISGRTDLLAGAFLIASLFLMIRSLLKGSVFFAVFAALCFLLACLCKDSSVFAYPGFLVIACVIAFSGERPGAKESARASARNALVSAVIPYTVTTVLYFLMRKVALSSGDSGISGVVSGITGQQDSLFHKFWLVGKVLGFYVKKIIIPWPQSFTITHVPDTYFFVAVLAFFLFGYLLWLRKLIPSLIIFSACLIAPALLVPLGGFAWTPIAERYVYLATPTFCIGMTCAVVSIASTTRFYKYLPILTGVMAAVLIYFVYERNLVWQSNLSLFADAVKKNPAFMPARNDFALAHQNAGMKEEAKRLYLSNSLPSSVKYSIITNINKASAMASMGKAHEARIMLKEAAYTETNPLYTDYLTMLISLDDRIMGEKGLSEEKRKELRGEVLGLLLALQKVTGDPVHYYTLGQRYLSMGDQVRALHFFDLAYENSRPSVYYYDAVKKLRIRLKK